MIKNSEYFIGLDVGTNSVGWAVTDENYNILKVKGKNAIGTHLFEEGKTAETRRVFRTAQRRKDRKRNRILLLNELFDSEICQIDVNFFPRLADSYFWAEDKKINQKNTIFNDAQYKDKDYHKEYPTVYHLRYELMTNKEKKFDIRLIYLAIAHILKNRGHFLFAGQDFNIENSFAELFKTFVSQMHSQLEIEIAENLADNIAKILREAITNTDKNKKLTSLLGKTNKQQAEIIKLLLGNKAILATIFNDDNFNETELKEIQFSKADYLDNEPKYAALLGEKMELITAVKAIYDWSVLSNILKGNTSISQAKIASYDQHKADLKILKQLLKQSLDKDNFSSFFANTTSEKNYCAYIGNSIAKNNSSVCSKEDFYKEIQNLLKPLADSEAKTYILNQIALDEFLPKQKTADNGVIPYQLHLKELVQILENAAKHYDFLNSKEAELTISDKIIAIMKFRIPYYVGPLNNYHKIHSWIVKKSAEKVYPWNFEKVVDLANSGEEFIKRMTNRCTYLIGADVLPINSLLYSKFTVLNIINKLKVNDVQIDVDTKQKIYNKLCFTKANITIKDIKNFLLSECQINKNDTLSGIDADLKLSLKPYLDFFRILTEQLFDEEKIEASIKTIVLFGGEKKIIKQRIQAIWGNLISPEQLSAICRLNYSGWGRLSKEFLTEVYHVDPVSNNKFNIIEALYATNNNLMQLLSPQLSYIKNIEERNLEINGVITKFSYETLVKPLYCSPAVKRGIWRTLNIVRELEKVLGKPPKKVFIETTRTNDVKGDLGRKSSRQKQLLAIYTKNSLDKDLLTSLKGYAERDLRIKKIYLYYTQLGRCMYSGKIINLADLLNKNLYDIDHIYPRSKTKDDSMDNLVLVDKNLNRSKTDVYPIETNLISAEALALWQRLGKIGLISNEKYKRLTRKEPFSNAELAGFINRQLVETSQSSKAVAEVLKQIFSEDQTEIVYVKSGNVSDFRKNTINRLKVREINDYHHAFDAYLNIVVGNVYNVKFTKNPLNFIDNAEYRSYSLKRIFDFDVKRGKQIAWLRGKEGTIQTVNKMLDTTRLQYTRYPRTVTGEFYKQMPLKKGSGEIPLKSADPRYQDKERYGGYTSDSGAYFILVKHLLKGKEARTIEYVPVRYAKKFELDKTLLLKYCLDKAPYGLELKSPKILIDKIKIDTLFNIDGFPMHISGRTGNYITFKPAVQLILDKESEQYLKKVTSFVERLKTDKDLKINAQYDKITAAENLKLYDLLLEKNNNKIYALRPASQIKVLQEGREKFNLLSLEQQCQLILQILLLTKCAFVRADLKLLGGAGQAGTVKKNKNISDYQKAKIINESPTGFYSQEIDLLKL